MPPHEAVLRATPVSLQLLYTNRLIPALLGQVGERQGLRQRARTPPTLGHSHARAPSHPPRRRHAQASRA
eukprot:5175234-Prymnesium_polylepis.1